MKAEKEEIAEEPFVIRPYLKSELAHLYNPYVPLVYAMRKMREWIRNNKELYDAMYSGGEGMLFLRKLRKLSVPVLLSMQLLSQLLSIMQSRTVSTVYGSTK